MDDSHFIIIEQYPDNSEFENKINILVNVGKQLNCLKINVVATISHYNCVIKSSNLNFKIRTKVISDINDFHHINKYLHMIKILLDTTYDELKFGQVSNDLFDEKIKYISNTLSNCQSHYDFCTKKIELSVNLDTMDILNNNIFSLYGNYVLSEDDPLYYILYPMLTLKYKCFMGSLIVQIDKMGDIILGPKEMFYFIPIIHSNIYQVIENLSRDFVHKSPKSPIFRKSNELAELSYIYNSQLLDIQILKYNSSIEYDDLTCEKINFTPTKKINNLINNLKDDKIKSFDEFIKIFKQLLFESRLCAVNILNDMSKNKQTTDLYKSSSDINIREILPCVINNYVHHIVFSNNLLLIKKKIKNLLISKNKPKSEAEPEPETEPEPEPEPEKECPPLLEQIKSWKFKISSDTESDELLDLTNLIDSSLSVNSSCSSESEHFNIDFKNMKNVGFMGLDEYIKTKCKTYINPNELFFVPVCWAKYLNSVFYHNAFSVWDFIWKLAVLQLATISKNPESLDADLFMYLKLYILGSADIHDIEFLIQLMELSLFSELDVEKYKLSKIPTNLISFFSNTVHDNSDSLILYSNSACTLSNVESILHSLKCIIDNHHTLV
jgi:hypothetical protein